MTDTSGLGSTAEPLADLHDALLLDLDGVVQLGDQPVRYAAETLDDARRRGLRVVFVTNNASRSAADVATSLQLMSVVAAPDDIVTSAMVAAAALADQLPAGAPVLVVGGSGLVAAVEAAGLRALRAANADVAAVVQGWAPEVDWAQLAEATIAIRRGVPWIATNDDRTLPSPRGPLPGNGSMIAAIATATGRLPQAVIGKPHPPLYEAAAARAGASKPLFVGDRLDTDVTGARRVGMASLLVLTGVSQPRDLFAAAERSRPKYVGLDLRALVQPQPPVLIADGVARCADASVSADGHLQGTGVALLRAACALAWAGELAADRYETVGHAVTAAAEPAPSANR